MKKFFSCLLPVLAFIFMSACDSQPDAIKIEGLEKYTDQITGFSLLIPKNWEKYTTVGERIYVVSTEQANERFTNYMHEGVPGAKVELYVVPLDSTQDFKSVVQSSKRFSDPKVYKGPQMETINGVQVEKYTYEFELSDGMFHGEMYAATKDNKIASILRIESFGDTWDLYKADFEKIKNSFVPRVKQEAKKKQDTIVQQTEAEPPSQNLMQKSGRGYSISIPDNFSTEKGNAAGAEFSASYIGERRGDSNIQIDILDAKNVSSVQKVAQDNSAKYQNATPQKTTIGGKEAYYMNYAFRGDVKSRVYFVLNNGKIYRITLNWYAPEQKDYLPVFEKSVKSMKFE
jgi:hypothetical protein